MSTRVVERVDDWTERPFDGGYRELQDLADAEFSGVVRAGGAELFMTRGTVVGIRRGSIDDFEEGSGTVYEAPTDALPLLAIMQARSDEVRAKYYSEETSISDVDNTLESGGFTGFVELSENVLSGDYYLVYHQGHSMAVAYVGNSQQLLTDDEAFERADDEVGIYEVRPVDIEPIAIPEPPEPEPEPEPEPTPAAGAGAAGDDTLAEEASESGPESTGTADTAETVVEPADEASEDGSDALTTADESSGGPDPTPAPDPEPSTGADAESTDPATDEPSVSDPEPDPEPSGSAADPSPAPDEPTEDTPETPRSETEPSPSERHDDAPGSARTESATPEKTEQESKTTQSERSASSAPGAVSETEPASPERTDQTAEPEDTRTAEQVAATQTEPARATESEPEPGERPSSQDDGPPTPTPAQMDRTEATSAVEERSSGAEDPSSLETRAIPSLDPELTSSRSRASANEPRRDAPGRADDRSSPNRGDSQTAEHREQSEPAQSASSQRDERTESEPASRQEETQTAEPEPRQTAAESDDGQAATGEETGADAGTDTGTDEAVSERIDELQDLLDEREKEITRLESSLQTAESERDSARKQLAELREERDELEAQVEKLESELHRLEEELGAATDAQQRMTPQEALSGTDIFVRYRSKGDATLEKAHQSGAVKKDVVENLRLEKHTQFDADISAVGGREYDQFLEDTVAYKFVTWVVEDLIFEIQGTGHTETLSELYDALPKINRVELNGAVNVTYTEDGTETQGTESFDIVFRERMGDPLLVANINDSRQGASEAMMEDLITAAERVGRTSDQFASAFLVTESFFEPEALETVAAATRGGILSRDKRKSFVNLSRKQGYHLCLVEARNQNFHLEVPEL
jgi:hypothetical protein